MFSINRPAPGQWANEQQRERASLENKRGGAQPRAHQAIRHMLAALLLTGLIWVSHSRRF
jgi:hypothetical protein